MKLSRLFLCLALAVLFFPGAAFAAPRPGYLLQATLPDLDAAFISRLPAYDYDDPVKNRPAPGDPVTFQAHVANRGGLSTGAYGYTWYIDGAPVLSASAASLAPGDSVILTLAWTWQDGPHTVGITLDPGGLVGEVTEQNNALEDRTNALAVGLWVEQSVYDYFNLHQVDVPGLGGASNSWDDWAQRQMRTWNQMFAGATSPLTPQGVIDRVRLDKVVVVADGALPPCATNFPDPEDKTVDLEWGFPAEEVGVQTGHVCGGWNLYIDNPDFMNIEYSLMHELSHARYLVDLYGFNVYVNSAALSAAAGSTATSLTVDRDIEGDYNFPIPAYLAIDGELVICQAKSGSMFSNCTRGAEGTLPRAHAAGALVNLALVRAQDGARNLVQGSAALPVIGWDDHLYYSRYQDDLMNGGTVYRQYSAYALNRIAGRRALCGNYNSPCNIGEYMRDLPAQNFFEIRGAGDQPLQWARVDVFRPRPYPSVYGKMYVAEPDLALFTDAQGRVSLGSDPFGDLPPSPSPSQGVLLLRITSAGEREYQFFEITYANEAYWSGDQASATYVIQTGLEQGFPPVFLPGIYKGFANLKTLTVTSQEADGEVLHLGCATWAACRGDGAGAFAYIDSDIATVAASFLDGAYEIKRVFYSFDTSALPAGATIRSARLRFYAGSYQNGDSTRVHVVNAWQDGELSGEDFTRVGAVSGGSASLLPDTWQEIALNSTAQAWVVKGGLTRLALVHHLDLTNTAPTGAHDSTVAMHESPGRQPELVIEYTTP